MQQPVEFVELRWRGRPVRIELQRVLPAHARPDAPLLVFLHEGLGSLAMWRDFPAALCDAAGVHGLVYSRPGYGRSTPRHPDERWDVDFMHRQAHEVLPALLAALHLDGTRRPLWLLGHSDGGSIALLHAARYPKQVSGLVVMAPHLYVEPKALHAIEQSLLDFEFTNLRGRLARHHADVDSAFRGWNDIWLHGPFMRWNIEREIEGITCPLLAMQGIDDEYGTLDQIHAIARRLPQTRLVEIPRCGHSPHRDQPARVIDEVARFLAVHASAGQPQHQPTA
ncbi:MAG: alpha/beta hydrolase [Burkholderiaceae bacterium]|nr:alpha/beta hydrolase [Burkholderiaceae bacterium]